MPTGRDAACRVSACGTNIGREGWEAIQTQQNSEEESGIGHPQLRGNATRFSFSDESEEVILELD
jgi:hypothetical protein